jgi:hypothetical protein
VPPPLSRTAPVAAALAAMMVAACASEGAVAGAEDARVTVTLHDANTRLEIVWSIVNTSGKPLFALTKPLRHNDRPAPETIYLRLADDGTIEFALRAFAVPDGMSVATLDHIAAVPLGPGLALEGKAAVALPLKTQEPYRRSIEVPLSAKRVRVCIGVLDAAAQFPVSTRQADGALATYHDARVVAKQRVVCSAPTVLGGG